MYVSSRVHVRLINVNLRRIFLEESHQGQFFSGIKWDDPTSCFWKFVLTLVYGKVVDFVCRCVDGTVG